MSNTNPPGEGIRPLDTSMDNLISRIEEGDPQLTCVALTSECESRDQLERLLAALEESTIVDSIIFRESFFPLRRIREHLDREDFFRMIHTVSWHVTDTLRLPPTMMGMVRGLLASLTVCPLVKHYHATEAITFALESDVLAMAERFEECTQLETLELGDCYVARMRPPCLDPILTSMMRHHESLTVLDLSCHPEQKIKEPLVTDAALESLSMCSLQMLNLSRLGLQDEHFATISKMLRRTTTLQWLCLDGNRPSLVGLELLADTLQENSSTLIGLSLLGIWNTDRVDWNRLFPSNWYLQHLEITGGFAASWLELNQRGRADWMQQDLPLNIWPLVLEYISDSPNNLWYILQTFPNLLSGHG